MATSEDSKEKRVTSAAKAQAATGRRVFTGTPSSFIMGISLGLPANAPNARGRRSVPLFKLSRESHKVITSSNQQKLCTSRASQRHVASEAAGADGNQAENVATRLYHVMARIRRNAPMTT